MHRGRGLAYEIDHGRMRLILLFHLLFVVCCPYCPPFSTAAASGFISLFSLFFVVAHAVVVCLSLLVLFCSQAPCCPYFLPRFASFSHTPFFSPSPNRDANGSQVPEKETGGTVYV
jgi:fatty acid desaturase